MPIKIGTIGTSLVAVLLGACSAEGPSVGQQFGLRAAGSTVFLSRTPKGLVQTFFNRLATADEQLVVTRAVPAGARESLAISVDPTETLYLVEPGPAGFSAARLPGERARLGGIAVIAVAQDADAHAVLGDVKAYTEAVASEETMVPAFGEPRLHLMAGDVSQLAGINLERAYLEEKLKELTGALPVTIGGRQVTISERKTDVNRGNARAWLRAQYEALGFTVRDVAYPGRGGVNLVAERAGADTTHFLAVTSHFDSVGNAGADDNGAGTIGALAIAKALQGKTLQTGLRIVAFDQEELGLFGSTAYARQLKDQNKLGELIGVINLEMIGYDADDDGAFHSIDCDENTSATLTRAVVQALAADASLRLHKVAACTDRSDHAAFWRYDRPAIVVSQNFFGGDDDPCYHLACDRVANVNFDYMTRLGTLMARTTAALVNAQ